MTALVSHRAFWRTWRVKRLGIVIFAVLLLGAGITAFFAFATRSTPPAAVLPTPNGYDDFAAAASWLVAWKGDLFALPPEGIRATVQQNSKALEEIHNGLKKQSAVPVTNDMNWFNAHMVQMAGHKQMAQLLVAEGLIHLQEGRTNEAARSFADGIAFAHAAHCHGLMIDDLVAIACQTMAMRPLLQVASQIGPDTRQEILAGLNALDQSRETASAIMQRDREWGRGAYGRWKSMWMRIVMFGNRRTMEAGFEKKHLRSVTSLRLAIAELAIRGYEAKNGKPPTTLADLVPAWLPAVPVDPFSDRPLIYRVTPDSFQLYSVGPDGTDDQGASLRRGQVEKGDLLPTTP